MSSTEEKKSLENIVNTNDDDEFDVVCEPNDVTTTTSSSISPSQHDSNNITQSQQFNPFKRG